MENAVEALKFAFAVMMFTMALGLSISSFSNATSAVKSIINMRDRETEYTYVEPTEDLTRTVGVETVVSSIYRASKENIKIYFFEKSGETEKEFYLYNVIDTNGNVIGISSIDLANKLESFANLEEQKEHLDIIIGGESVLDEKSEAVKQEYKDKLIYTEGLYEKFKNAKFEERLGEYYEGSQSTGIKTRVITYVIQN